MDFQEIDTQTLKKQLAGENPPVVVDVREPYEYGEGVIPNAVFIPMNDIPDRMDELDKDADIVIYCAHGIRSAQVAAYLTYKGFANVKSLADGYVAWAYYAR
jgi:rhodanese-related sulfurtransferase